MPPTKRRSSEAQTPTKSPATAKSTPARSPASPSPSSKAKKGSHASSSSSATPTPKADRSTLPSTSPAPRAPPTTPVATSKAAKSAQKSTPSKPQPVAAEATSFVLDTAEGRQSYSRKRAHSTSSATPTPARPSRVRLQNEAEEDDEAAALDADHLPVGPRSHLPAAVAELLHPSTGSASTKTTGGGLRSLVEQAVLQTSTIAPDVSGIRCFAFNEREDALVVAREDGSLIAYHLAFHQNIPHFTQRRHTGGCLRRTVTQLHFVRVPVHDVEAAAVLGVAPQEREAGGSLYKEYLLASYLSGQLVFLDVDTLFPIAVHQRTGGAIWDFCVVPNQPVIYAAIADGSWHQLLLTLERYTPQHPLTTITEAGQDGDDGESDRRVRRPSWRPSLVLERIVSGISGADRALSVCCAPSLRLVVGTDDAGNIHAWRLRRAQTEATAEAASLAAMAAGSAGRGGLVDHETAWTTRLPKGIPLCSAISTASSSRRPAVAVGTSMGDVVLLDAETGDIFATFSQHKGPVSTVTFDRDAFYASGWHDSLRAYRCTSATDGSSSGEWYPAEVKRRTHYHEATQVSVLPQRQLMLSASRDGTLMYAPLAQVFATPAMYLRASAQQFALCAEKNVLVQTRLNRVEAFRMDSACRHWSPLFAYTLAGHFHISRLWTDAALHYMVVATDDRVVLVKVCWREGAEAALVVSRLEEVLELPAARGVLDVCFVPSQPSDVAADHGAAKKASVEEEQEAKEEDEEATATVAEGNVYLLYDTTVVHVSLSTGYPAVTTALAHTTVAAGALSGFSPSRLFVVPQTSAKAATTTSPKASKKASTSAAPSAFTGTSSLLVYGRSSTWRCDLTVDGLPNIDTITVSHNDALALATLVPALCAGLPATTASTPPTPSRMLVGLSASAGRYVYSLVDGATSSSSSSSPSPASSSPSDVVELPRTLPHDCTFVAYMPIHTADLPGGRFSLAALQHTTLGETTTTTASTEGRPAKARRQEAAQDDGERAGRTEYLLFGYFSKGILVASRREWRMLYRSSTDMAAPLKDGAHVLFVEQNLERTLEALPLCWKVRRFGN